MDLPLKQAKRDSPRSYWWRIWQSFKKSKIKGTLPKRVAVVTTLNPENPERQVKALQNWRKLKAPVFSLNVKSEQDRLVDQYPWIHFENPTKTAEHIVGKPFVLFDSFLEWFSKHQELSHIVILNSDISVPIDSGFWKSAVGLARESLVFGNRLDVNYQNEELNKVFKVGFDFFILSRELIPCYPPSEFCLGAPWWDYWVPFVPLLQNIPCVYAQGTYAKHDWHETQWDIGLYLHYCREFISHAESFGMKMHVPDAVSANNQISCKQFANRTSKSILSKIYQESETVTLSE